MSVHDSPAILIADDDPIIVRMYKLMLTRVGYQVAAAVDGCDALKKIAQRQPDLLILDYMMPNLNGIEVLNHLARNPQSASIPVLFISTTVTEMDLESEPVAHQMVVEMLSKPVGMQDLREHVAHLIGPATLA